MKDQAVFKGALWDKGTTEINGTTVYKTVIVGMIISSEPLSEAVIDSRHLHKGQLHNLQTAFKDIKAVPAGRNIGDAVDVLFSLNDF